MVIFIILLFDQILSEFLLTSPLSAVIESSGRILMLFSIVLPAIVFLNLFITLVFKNAVFYTTGKISFQVGEISVNSDQVKKYSVQQVEKVIIKISEFDEVLKKLGMITQNQNYIKIRNDMKWEKFRFVLDNKDNSEKLALILEEWSRNYPNIKVHRSYLTPNKKFMNP